MSESEFVSIKNWSEDEQPREKLLKHGKLALSNAELMTILIATGTRKKSALDLSKEILQKAKQDLNELAKLTVKDLCKIDGIGPAKAITIIAAIELGGRRQQWQSSEKRYIKSSRAGFEIMKHKLQDLNHEEFWIITLHRNNSIISEHRISEGGIAGTVVDIKKIFKIALDDKACSIMMFHNHPSGNNQPSESDNRITRQISDAGKLIDINVIDHIIIAQQNYYSYADEGLMF